MIQSPVAEVPQEGIPRPQGQKSQGCRLRFILLRKEAVDHLEAGPVSPYGQKAAVTAAVGFAAETGGLLGASGFHRLHRHALRPQPLQGRRGLPPAAPAAGSRIDDGEVGFHGQWRVESGE